ncbi:hypothetical protein J3E69DRAFT_373859 [Trichoderma sp. SZMC 28015]
MLPPGPPSGVAATSSSGVQGLEYRDLQDVEGVCSTLSSAKVRSLAKLILASRLFDSLLAISTPSNSLSSVLSRSVTDLTLLLLLSPRPHSDSNPTKNGRELHDKMEGVKVQESYCCVPC